MTHTSTGPRREDCLIGVGEDDIVFYEGSAVIDGDDLVLYDGEPLLIDEQGEGANDAPA